MEACGLRQGHRGGMQAQRWRNQSLQRGEAKRPNLRKTASERREGHLRRTRVRKGISPFCRPRLADGGTTRCRTHATAPGRRPGLLEDGDDPHPPTHSQWCGSEASPQRAQCGQHEREQHHSSQGFPRGDQGQRRQRFAVRTMCSLDALLGEQHFVSVVFLSKTRNPCLILRKAPSKAHTRDGVTNT